MGKNTGKWILIHSLGALPSKTKMHYNYISNKVHTRFV